MSRFRTVAMGAVVVLGFAGVAGAQTPPQALPQGQDKVEGRQSSEGRRMRQRRPGRKMRQGGREHGRLMSDLNLTEAQKTRVKSIHEKYQPQFNSLREQGKTQFKAMRDARQKGDTSAAARAQLQQQREQFRQRTMALRQQEQSEVRSVLTTEQRTKFDTRVAEQKQRMEDRKRGGRGGAGGARRGKAERRIRA